MLKAWHIEVYCVYLTVLNTAGSGSCWNKVSEIYYWRYKFNGYHEYDNSLMLKWQRRFIRKHYISWDIEYISYNAIVYYYIKYGTYNTKFIDVLCSQNYKTLLKSIMLMDTTFVCLSVLTIIPLYKIFWSFYFQVKYVRSRGDIIRGYFFTTPQH